MIQVLGYADAAGTGQPLPKQFSEDDFARAKSLHRYPEGVKHLKMLRVEGIRCAVFIGDNIGEALENMEKIRQENESKVAAKRVESNRAHAAIDAAQKKVQGLAKARNELQGRLHSAESKLAAHEGTPEGLRGKNFYNTLKEIQALILGDPEKRVAGLKAQVSDAISFYEAAAAELAELTKNLPAPKSQLAS